MGGALVIPVIMEIHTDFPGLFQTLDMTLTRRNQMLRDWYIFSQVEHKNKQTKTDGSYEAALISKILFTVQIQLGLLVIYGRPFVSKLWHDIRAFFCRHVFLRSFLLCGVFIPKYIAIFLQTRIHSAQKKPIYMPYKQACVCGGHRNSLYKRHRIIPSAKNPFMYDGPEK